MFLFSLLMSGHKPPLACLMVADVPRILGRGCSFAFGDDELLAEYMHLEE